MKKTFQAIISLSLLLALILSLAACSPTAPEKTSEEIDTSSGADNQENSSLDSVTNTAVYGKISGIAGNEMEISLAKDPYADLTPDNNNGAVTNMPGAKVHIAATDDGAENNGEAPKLQLEYTGESKSYTLPAGVKITGKNGGEAQLDALKKGNVLMLMTDNDRVVEIAILE